MTRKVLSCLRRSPSCPEYYVTRTERQILAEHAEEIVTAAAGGRDLSMIELGAGTATKTGLLLNAAVGLQGSVILLPHRCVGNGPGGSTYQAGGRAPGSDCGTHRGGLHRGYASEQCFPSGKKAGALHRLEHRQFLARGRARSSPRCARPTLARRLLSCWERTW